MYSMYGAASSLDQVGCGARVFVDCVKARSGIQNAFPGLRGDPPKWQNCILPVLPFMPMLANTIERVASGGRIGRSPRYKNKHTKTCMLSLKYIA